MNKEIAEAVALLRHEIISPVLMDTQHSQMRYFRSLEGKMFDVPGKGPRAFKATTMKMWLRRYRTQGIKGITPGDRADRGGYRKINPKLQQEILELRKEKPELSVARFYEFFIEKNVLGIPPLCLATIRRFLKMNRLAKPRSIEVRKKFEMSTFGELWTADYMHGPKVKIGNKKRKAILFAIIDDFSRFIVGSSFGLSEDTMSIESVFKEAILIHGLPDKIYLDNGPSFSSHYLKRVCAHLGVGLIHSRPYDSPSRGKIERFFRTVREGFLNQIKDELAIEELNEEFKIWLRDDYAMLKLPSRFSKVALFDQIQEGIWDLYKNQGKIPCIILDECHLMEDSTLQELTLLTNFEMDSQMPLILILSGQLDLSEVLKRRRHEPLNQRITLRYQMNGMNFEDTKKFIDHHLRVVGRNDPLFDESGYEVVHKLAGGLPRKIGNYCRGAMTLAALKGMKIINGDLVHKAASGL